MDAGITYGVGVKLDRGYETVSFDMLMVGWSGNGTEFH